MKTRLAAFFLAGGCATAVISSPVLSAAEWFVSTDGKPKATGAITDPWDLQTALNGPESVQPGDTIWLREGTYRHPDRSHAAKGYLIRLSGSPDAPITIRNHDGGRATIDGGLDRFSEVFS